MDMHLEYRKLEESEIADLMKDRPGWDYKDGKLHREFTFESYLDGLAFASAVGFLAERLNHHPDIAIGYRKVAVQVNTHDVNGVSSYDFELARRIDQL